MKELVEKVLSDPRYLANVEYGEPRAGHPEGKVKHHIRQLEQILDSMRNRGISGEEYWKLKFLIHVHDAFKAEARPDVPIRHPESHASLARQYAAGFGVEGDLQNMIQYHDENYALWHQFERSGAYDEDRFRELLARIEDWNLFLKFIIIDGSTPGKDRSKLIWFIREVRQRLQTDVDESWVPQLSESS